MKVAVQPAAFALKLANWIPSPCSSSFFLILLLTIFPLSNSFRTSACARACLHIYLACQLTFFLYSAISPSQTPFSAAYTSHLVYSSGVSNQRGIHYLLLLLPPLLQLRVSSQIFYSLTYHCNLLRLFLLTRSKLVNTRWQRWWLVWDFEKFNGFQTKCAIE